MLSELHIQPRHEHANSISNPYAINGKAASQRAPPLLMARPRHSVRRRYQWQGRVTACAATINIEIAAQAGKMLTPEVAADWPVCQTSLGTRNGICRRESSLTDFAICLSSSVSKVVLWINSFNTYAVLWIPFKMYTG